jgi:hypothetical protein
MTRFSVVVDVVGRLKTGGQRGQLWARMVPHHARLVAVSAAAPGTLSLDEDVQQVETLGATQYVDTAMLGYPLRYSLLVSWMVQALVARQWLAWRRALA